MATDPVLRMLGLARRAGKLAYGDELVREACFDHKTRCVFIAGDAGANAAKKAAFYADKANVPCVTLPHGKLELGSAIGKAGCAMCAVADIGMAAAAVNKLAEQDPAYAEVAQQLSEKNAKIQSRRGVKKHKDKAEKTEEGKPVRIIRNAETNLGDLCADAYRYVSGADIAFVNGGGIRVSIKEGDITLNDILKVHPFGNALCVCEATGQQILDALEFGAKDVPGEFGGFLQVSGLTYEIHTYLPSTVKMDEKRMFVGVEGEYRVKNVMVGGEPLDLEKIYTLASHNYMLQGQGDGYTIFEDNVYTQESVMLDNQVLITYITEGLNGVVGADYANPYGQGRIVAVE